MPNHPPEDRPSSSPTSPPEAARRLASGQMLGNVRLTQLLGQGAMGTVWRGHHLPLDMPVAVKVMRPLSTDNPLHGRQSLQREARLTARLNHPGIVRVLDYLEDHGRPCIVMELVEGTTLGAYLHARGSFPERTALLIGFHLCAALAAAHAAGILHRDIKPSNVLIALDGTLKLTDFGLAQPLAAPMETSPRHILGTPLYMAPEFFTQEHAIDQRCDLYSLGVILYQLMTGSTPFAGSTSEVVQGHVHQAPDLDRIPAGSRPILSCLLEKDAARRIGDALAVREMIRARGRALDEAQSGTDPSVDLFEGEAGGAFATHSAFPSRKLPYASVRHLLAIALALAAAIAAWRLLA